jgi:hypothetical protein
LEYAEESSFGIPVASPSYNQIGYDVPVQISAPTNLSPVLQPGSEDPQVLQERRIDEYAIDMQYHPFDTVFAKYGFNAQGGGSGTIDKSLTLAMSILLGGGPTETYLQALGCRIERLTIGGKAGGPISVKTKIVSQNIPVPSTTVLPGSFAANPSSTPFLFKEGGAQPISIGGTQYNVNSISVTANRNLDQIPQPNSDLSQIILPRERKITGTIGLVWINTDNYSRLRNDTSFSLIWTIRTGVSTMTLTGCRFKALQKINLDSKNTVYESYSMESTSGVLT